MSGPKCIILTFRNILYKVGMFELQAEYERSWTDVPNIFDDQPWWQVMMMMMMTR